MHEIPERLKNIVRKPCKGRSVLHSKSVLEMLCAIQFFNKTNNKPNPDSSLHNLYEVYIATLSEHWPIQDAIKYII